MFRKTLLLPLTFCIFLLACGSSQKQEVSSDSGDAKSEEKKKDAENLVEVVQFDAIEDLMNDESGNLKVVNFWATWCGPCVKELPYFEKAYQKYSDKGVDFVLVSMDFAEDLESKVIPFVKKKGLKSRVILLDNDKYDTWIGKVSKDWDGAIPATLFVNKKEGVNEMYVGEMDYIQLDETLAAHLKLNSSM